MRNKKTMGPTTDTECAAQFAGRTTTGLELTLGFRYSNDEKKARRTYDLAQGGPVDQRSKFSASRVDPAAVIKYSWTDKVNTYLRYATGYRAGGANVRSSNFSSFGEEENKAWRRSAPASQMRRTASTS